VLSYELV